jgi:branched-subunit amino acid transport protein
MTTLPLILGMAALIYACRLAGFLIPNPRLTPYWGRVFHLLPIAVFATLVTSGLARVPTLQLGHLLTFVIAGLITWRTRQIGLSVLVGLVLLWVLSMIGAA